MSCNGPINPCNCTKWAPNSKENQVTSLSMTFLIESKWKERIDTLGPIRFLFSMILRSKYPESRKASYHKCRNSTMTERSWLAKVMSKQKSWQHISIKGKTVVAPQEQKCSSEAIKPVASLRSLRITFPYCFIQLQPMYVLPTVSQKGK